MSGKIFDRKTGTLLAAFRELKRVPTAVAKEYGDVTQILNFKGNELEDGRNLRKFPILHTLVLDDNSLESLDTIPNLPKVHTLWLNNNSFSDLPSLVTDLAVKFPSLKELSMIRNPACPGFSSLTKNEERENKRYRLYTIAHLPNLIMLDCSPVSKAERAEALRVENERRKQVVGQRLTEENAARVAAASVPSRNQKVYDGGKKAPLTVVEKKYFRSGESGPSEGNRFIGNADL